MPSQLLRLAFLRVALELPTASYHRPQDPKGIQGTHSVLSPPLLMKAVKHLVGGQSPKGHCQE